VQAQPAWLERIEIGTRSQSVAFRPDVGDIHQSSAENGHPQLPLETKRPAFGVRVAEILLERAVLRVSRRLGGRGAAAGSWANQLGSPRPGASVTWSMKMAFGVAAARSSERICVNSEKMRPRNPDPKRANPAVRSGRLAQG